MHLLNNKSYQKRKNFFRKLLTNRETSYARYFDGFMIVLILISVTVMVVNKRYDVPEWLLFVDFYLISFVFLVEYLLRFWIHDDIHKLVIEYHKKGDGLLVISKEAIKRKLKYIFSIPAIIDFLAIFPQFRIVRLLKLYHYLYGVKTLLKALSSKEFEFRFLAYIVIVVVFSFASILYVMEYEINEKINSFLDALYWALVTISTVGYGDITPITDAGKAISMIGIIFGIAMISFVTSVMVSAFAERFDELRTHSSINRLYNMDNIVVINGFDYLGSRIVHYLSNEEGYNCVVIEGDREKFNCALNSSCVVIYGDAYSSDMMKRLNKHNIVAMLTLKSSDIDNIYFILNVKSHNPKQVVFSRITHKHLHLQYKSIGTDLVINPYAIIHKQAFHYVEKYIKEHPNTSVMLFGFGQKSRDLAYKLHKNGIEVKIYDNNSSYIKDATEAGFAKAQLIDFENCSDMQFLSSLKQGLVICSMDDEAINHYLAISIKVDVFYGKIVALSDTKQNNHQLKLAGVDIIFDFYDESAKEFVWQLKGESK